MNCVRRCGPEETFAARFDDEETPAGNEATHHAALSVRAGHALLHGYALDETFPSGAAARLQCTFEAVLRLAGKGGASR